MANISASEVAKLRNITGAGMMDCKAALTEAEGDFDKAVEILRKKGQKVANKRADRESKEGVVIATNSANNKIAYMISLNCETDFVAKNEDFVKKAEKILSIAKETNAKDLADLLTKKFDDKYTIEEEIFNMTGVIGEKIGLGIYSKIEAGTTGYYIHSDKKIATIVGLNKENINEEIIKDVAMQATAMNPVSVDEKSVPQSVIDKEIEIGKEIAINEGKNPEMAEKIARGKLTKFFKDSTLLNQDFIKDNKITVKDYLQSKDKELTVTEFVRFSLRD